MAKKTTTSKLVETLATLQKLHKTEKNADLKNLISSVVALLDGNVLLAPQAKPVKAPKVKKEKVAKVKKVKAPKVKKEKVAKVKKVKAPKSPKVAKVLKPVVSKTAKTPAAPKAAPKKVIATPELAAE